MERKPIEMHMTLMDMIHVMAEGNPGAVTVMAEIIKAEPKDAMMWLLRADDMNLRGPLLWVAYKDGCSFDVHELIRRIKLRDAALVTLINRMCPPPNYRQAVTSGASSTR